MNSFNFINQPASTPKAVVGYRIFMQLARNTLAKYCDMPAFRLRFMPEFRKNSENPFAYIKEICVLFLLLNLALLSGCASQFSVNKHGVNADCIEPSDVISGQVGKKQRLIRVCALKGIFEIAENYSIDSDIRALFNKAVVLLKNGDYQGAIGILKQVVKKEQKFTAPYINLGIAYFRTDKLKKAEKNFLKALKLNAVHPVANSELGMLYRKTGRYREARERYEAVLDEYPGFMPVRRNFAVLCDIYLQDLPCAHQQYEAYLLDDPKDEQVKIWMLDLKNRM